jgi:uncharacterized small protein (TIGR04563 family)
MVLTKRAKAMNSYEKRKRSLYLPDEHLKEMMHEAKRQDRSLSWIVQQAWQIARNDIQNLPSVADALSAKKETKDWN